MNQRISMFRLMGGVLLVGSMACGGGGGGGNSNPQVPIAVSLSPTTANLTTGSAQTFTATVTGTTNTAVTWSVQEGAAGGVINPAGVYTAPSTTGVFHVVATSAANASKSATATVTVTAPVAITIAPTSINLTAGSTQTFTAAVTGTTNTAVTWSVQEGAVGGTIDPGGVYTAPNGPGVYHVVATSTADASKSATASVTVTAPVAITITPTSVSLMTGGTQVFTAMVTGTANTAVTWSVPEGAAGGTINAGGSYIAPGVAGTYHVVATSVGDTTKSAVATVAVTVPVASSLAYGDPTTGVYRLLRNATLSTPTHLVLDLTGVGGPSGNAIAFTLIVDPASSGWARVSGSDLEYVENGTVLALGSAPQALKGKVAAGTLTGVIGQKGTGVPVALNGVLGRVALDLNPSAPLGQASLGSPKAQVLQADGTIATVSLAVGVLTIN